MCACVCVCACAWACVCVIAAGRPGEPAASNFLNHQFSKFWTANLSNLKQKMPRNWKTHSFQYWNHVVVENAFFKPPSTHQLFFAIIPRGGCPGSGAEPFVHYWVGTQWWLSGVCMCTAQYLALVGLHSNVCDITCIRMHRCRCIMWTPAGWGTVEWYTGWHLQISTSDEALWIVIGVASKAVHPCTWLLLWIPGWSCQ